MTKTTEAGRKPGHLSFTLNDADGNPHAYELMPHPAAEGQEILFTLIGMGAEPLGALVQSALLDGTVWDNLRGSYKEGGLNAIADLDQDSILGGVNLGDFGKHLSSVLLRTDCATLSRSMLEYAYRDGVLLDTETAFSQAYRANYGELLKALWKSIELNRFFPLSGIF